MPRTPANALRFHFTCTILGESEGDFIALRVALVLWVATCGALAWLWTSQVRFAQAAEQVDAAQAEYSHRRVKRPVLARNPSDGNAAAALWEAVGALPPLLEERRRGLAEAIHYGQNRPDPELMPDDERAAVGRLAVAGSRGWAMTNLDLRSGTSVRVPEYPLVVDAVLRLLYAGMSTGPGECLSAATQAIRLGQDLVPGGPLEASSVSARITALAVRTLGFCTAEASRAQLEHTWDELRMLMAHAPLADEGVRFRALLLASDLLMQADLRPPLGPLGLVSGVWRRRSILPSVEQQLAFTAHLPVGYPALLAAVVEAEQSAGTVPGAAFSAFGPETQGLLLDDMRGQALLRAATLGVSALLDYHRRGQLPREPSALRDPRYADPFTGRPLHQRFVESQDELLVWSVGEDFTDGAATDRWNLVAPRDAVVRLRIRPPTAAARAASARHARRP